MLPSQLVESSPHDFFWGSGWDHSGHNHLGRLLMLVREQLLREFPDEAPRPATPAASAAGGRETAEPSAAQLLATT